MRRSPSIVAVALLATAVTSCSGSSSPVAPFAPATSQSATGASRTQAVLPNVIANGGFESGSLSSWTSVGTGTGAARVVTSPTHAGSYAAAIGTTAKPEVNGLYGIEQSVTIPAGGTLSLDVQGSSNDSLTYADQEVDLLDANNAVVTNCWKQLITTTAWQLVTCDVSAYAGQTLNVFVGVKGNGYASGYVSLDVDDVSLTGTSSAAPSAAPSTSAPPSGTGGANVVVNGGFETGSLAPWSAYGGSTGAPSVVTSKANSGSYSAFMGTRAKPEVNGLVGVAQTVTVPVGGTLSLYVQGYSNDTIAYADQEADLLDASGAVVTQCFKALLRTTTWTFESCDVSAYAGRTLTLFAGVRGTGSSAYYVDAYYDDIQLTGSGGATAPPTSTPSASPGATATPTAAPTPAGSPTPGASATPTARPTATPTPAPTSSPGTSPIQHVVIILQENRTFENIFHGYPGAQSVNAGVDSNGTSIPLQAVHLMTSYDPAHRYTNWKTEYDGGLMNGFDKETLDYGTSPGADFAYAYAMKSDVQPYWDLAAQGALGDNTFADHRSQSFAGHQYPIAGASGPISASLPNYYAAENPSGGSSCASPGTGTAINLMTGAEDQKYTSCFTYKTIADLLTAKGKTWAYYIPTSDRDGEASGFAAISSIRNGPAWTTNVLSPETQFFTDLSNGKLANVTYVVGQFVNSDHAGQTVPSSNGPAWVTMVANAVGTSSFWNSTAIIFAYDDWGGWYDEVKPATFDAYEPGFRIPFVVVSPYARRGTVDHTTHYIGSILHFIESTFGLGSLGTSDARSDDLSSMFNYTQPPLQYITVTSAASPASLFRQNTNRDPALDRD